MRAQPRVIGSVGAVSPAKSARVSRTHAPRRGAGVASGEPLGVDELTRLLGELGLTRNESRVYVALLTASVATAAEIAAAAAVPRPKVYEALASLESFGFCGSAGEAVRRYTAVAPDVALHDWVAHRDHERALVAEQDRSHAHELNRALPRPRPQSRSEVPDFIEGVSGRLPTTEMLEALMGRAAATLYEMLQPPFLQPRSRWNTREIEALARGVKVRVIYTPEALRDPRRYRPLLEHGGEARVLDRLPMKLLVRDKEEALISLRDAATGAQSTTSARVHHGDLVAPLATLFAQTWRRARPLTSQD
jgi:HTH-type transcriptional regulator, sugar sensing transcriptional regulator